MVSVYTETHSNITVLSEHPDRVVTVVGENNNTQHNRYKVIS